MGKTHRRNDRWKKDRRDTNFQKSKKFKESNSGINSYHDKKPSDSITVELESDSDDDI